CGVSERALPDEVLREQPARPVRLLLRDRRDAGVPLLSAAVPGRHSVVIRVAHVAVAHVALPHMLRYTIEGENTRYEIRLACRWLDCRCVHRVGHLLRD